MISKRSKKSAKSDKKELFASRWRLPSRVVLLLALIGGIFTTFPKTATVSDTSTLSWAAHLNIDQHNKFNSVSCTSSTFCMAVDNQGNYSIWNGKIWASKSIKSVTTNATDPDNDGDTDSDGQAALGDISSVTSVSCLNPSFCIAVGRRGQAFVWTGTAFKVTILGQVQTENSSVQNHSVTSTNSENNGSTTTTGETSSTTTSSTTTSSTTTSSTTTSSTTPTTSAATTTTKVRGKSGLSKSITVLDNTNVGDSTTSTASTTTSTSTPSSSTTGSSTSTTGDNQSSNHSRTRQSSDSSSSSNEDNNFQAAGNLQAVSCSSTTYCVTIDEHGASYLYNGSSWGYLSQISSSEGDNGGNISSLSCAGGGFCMAIDTGGNFYSLQSAKWAGPSSIDSNNTGDGGLASISCASSNFCVAVDSSANYLTWNGTAWTQPLSMNSQDVGSPTSVSCPTAGFCVAADTQGYALTWSSGSSSWSSTQVPGDNSPNLTSVSCSSGSFCAAVDTNGDAFNGTAASVVTSIAPTSGPPLGGTAVVITGSGFNGTESVQFGSVTAAFTVNGDTSITATSPPGTGTVPVTVTTPSGTSVATANTNFSYSSTVTAISPASGSSGTPVTITGTGFTSPSTVDFGNNAATNVVVGASGSSITATAPAGTGTVPVTVTSNGVQAAEPTPINFVYLPAIKSLAPTSGPATGGTTVTISGTGFTSGSTVSFGGVAATGVSVSSDGTSITATTPSGAGSVQVSVTPSGGSAVVAGQFAYVPVVIGMIPNSGPATGGTPVIISGSGFTSGSTVSFDSVPATNVTFNSGTSITATSPGGSGTVQVTVSNAGGTSATSSNTSFSYTASVTAVTPSSATAKGGTQVTITGAGFTSGSTVSFGGTAATGVSVNPTGTSITATSPAGLGTVLVTVTINGAQATETTPVNFTYLPTITSLSPNSGPASGGTTVTIAGSGFTQASTVSFGGTAATGVSVSTDGTSITATAPAGSGTVHVTVTPPAGSPVVAGQFAYVPVISSITPSLGPATGGTTVTIAGSGFTQASTVYFGGTPASNVTINSAGTSLVATSPGGTGIVQVTVSNAAGTSTTNGNTSFSYVPVVTGITPGSGPATGGTVVTINGAGFITGSTVSFGGTAATGVNVNPTGISITATAPAGSGIVQVTVSNAAGTSTTNGNTSFSYVPVVTGITPGSGPATGGTVVTINGAGFITGSTVSFGGTAATGVNVNPTGISITATAPAGSGIVQVTVSNAAGTSTTNGNTSFSYVPVVTGITPGSGPATGGTVVTINGAGFITGSTVSFGGTAATGVNVNPTGISITATAPAGSGIVQVTVSNAAGTSTTNGNTSFSYVPVVTSLSPNSGSANGDTAVTISGAGFTPDSTVNFGSTFIASVTVSSSGTSISVVSPGGIGIVAVTVSTPAGNSLTNNNANFDYIPVINSMTPTSGPASGGTSVTISGNGFAPGSTVAFGAEAATTVTVDGTGTSITAISPGGVGTVQVAVSNTAGTSATSSKTGFSYVPVLSGLSPNSGSANGGTSVTLSGAGFASGSTVHFGSAAATVVNVNAAGTSLTATSPAGSGTVQVTVTDSAGTSTTNGNTAYSYIPVVTGLTPNSGPATGGTSVTITGSGFTSDSTVSFGGSSVSNVTVNAAGTSLTVSSPGGIGSVQVSITTGSNTVQAGSFGYVPVVSGLTPNSGPATGGTSVTITGSGFTSDSTVSFGKTPATDVSVSPDGTSIIATSPGGSGTVQVTVTDSAGTSTTNGNTAYSYVPVVTGLSPNSGSANGGTTVTITGFGFTSGSTVDFGNTLIASVTVNAGGTSITLVSPGGIGVVPVSVTTSGGTSATNASTNFDYTPVVNILNPASGSAGGGTVVTITGNGFASGSTVKFGNSPATSVTVSSSGTSITATSPAGTGTVQVTVTNSSGTSATGSLSSFTYIPVVTGLTPTSGLATGGTIVTINGNGFVTGLIVDFGNTPATALSVNSSGTAITATSPGGSGAVAVTVIPSGGTAVPAGQFAYVPTITAISPSSGSSIGGTAVTITGAGFTPGSTVNFGDTLIASVTVDSTGKSIALVSPGGIGEVPVSVTNASGTSSKVNFGYTPVISGMTPTSGPASGGTIVTINGNGFASGSTVYFGNVPASSIIINNSGTSISATSPGGSGTVAVSVTSGTQSEQAGNFSYVPVIANITPSLGPGTGGTVVTISGAGFTPGSTVSFGGTPATAVSVNSGGTSITATSPGGVGTVQVTVTTSGGTSTNSPFTYIPVVTGITPNSGPGTGGTVVTISGAGFTPGSTVSFGGTPATAVSVNSGGTSITATSPGGVGTVQVTIISGSNSVQAGSFVYLQEVTGITPNSGPGTGGTVVTISGAGFTPGSTVSFGGTPATAVSVNSGGTSITATSPGGVGTVQVTVSNSLGTSATNTNSSFSYIPVVTGITPNSGPGTGGTVVTISGAGFTPGSTVSFGGTPATAVSVNSGGTSITATSPGGVGTVQVTVTTSGGTSTPITDSSFTYTPVVTSVSPNTGPASGGTVVTISGAGFTPDATVSFGTTLIASTTVNTAGTSITVVSPSGLGVVAVSVTTSGGTSGTSSFGYVSVVTGISPSTGPASGGTVVAISGAGFTPGSTVSFGGTPATAVSVNSGGTSITATSPGGVGTVQVTVTTATGSSSLNPSTDNFRYLPTVTGLNPSNGSANGGTSVIVTGSGFTGATEVSFGSTNASKFNVISDTKITASSPAGTGTVAVLVTTPSGTSPVTTTTAGDFTYSPVVTSVTPNSGSAAGATNITIAGSGFTGTKYVTFGGVETTSFTVNSDGTSITLKSPTTTLPSTSLPSSVDITVTTASGGTSMITSADQYTYKPAPTAPKLGVTLTPDTIGVTTGTAIGFSITASNSGGTAATAASLTDTLPTAAGVNWTLTNGPANCNIQNGILSCGPSDLAAGSSYSVHVTSPTTTATCGTTGLATLTDSTSLEATNVGSPALGQSQVNVVCVSTVTGQIVDANGTPVANASVALCPANPVLPNQPCASAVTNTQGYYSIGSLPAGNYNGTVTTLLGTMSFTVTVAGTGGVATVPVNQIKGLYLPMPPLVSLKSGSLPTQTQATTTNKGALPNLVSTAVTSISKQNACPNAKGATFSVWATDENPSDKTYQQLVEVTTQPLVETPVGSGTYDGSFPALDTFPNGLNLSGSGQITMDVPCPSAPAEKTAFTVYIDPSGIVVNQNGVPLAGVSVTLLTSPTGTPGTYQPVPNGSAIMSPANRTNPQVTDSSGIFGWDVIAGYYELSASLSGCTSTPLDFQVPPSLSNVSLSMNCAAPPPSSTQAPVNNLAPTNVNASPGNASATVSWTAPTDNGSSQTSGYQVTPYLGTVAQAPQTFNSSATTENVTGLTNGATYTFKVAAINAAGEGPLSLPSNPVIPSTVPAAPTNVTASPGNSSATIIWNSPSIDGGSPITAYMVTPYIGNAPQTPQIFNSPSTADTVVGLTNGTPYTFKVAAINAAGTGPNSQSSNPITPENSLGPVPPSSGSNGSGPSAVVNSSGGSGTGTSSSGSGGVLTGGGTLISPSIGSNALVTSLSFNISDTANVVGNLTSGSLYTFIWFFGWLLICVISGRYFFYRRRELDEPGRLKVVVK